MYKNNNYRPHTMTAVNDQLTLFPTLCVPSTPGWVDEDYVANICKGYSAGKFNIEGGPVLKDGKDTGRKAFFINFEPTDKDYLHPDLFDMFERLEKGIPVKKYVTERMFWYFCLSKHDHHRKTTEVVEPTILFGDE